MPLPFKDARIKQGQAIQQVPYRYRRSHNLAGPQINNPSSRTVSAPRGRTIASTPNQQPQQSPLQSIQAGQQLKKSWDGLQKLPEKFGNVMDKFSQQSLLNSQAPNVGLDSGNIFGQFGLGENQAQMLAMQDAEFAAAGEALSPETVGALTSGFEAAVPGLIDTTGAFAGAEGVAAATALEAGAGQQAAMLAAQNVGLMAPAAAVAEGAALAGAGTAAGTAAGAGALAGAGTAAGTAAGAGALAGAGTAAGTGAIAGLGGAAAGAAAAIPWIGIPLLLWSIFS